MRPRPLITVLVGEDTFKHLCELSTGTVIKAGQIVPWLSDADIETVLFDGRQRVIGVTYKRSFTGAVRRAVEVRDRRCQHPSGCDEPASRCDVDHIVPHSEGGITSQDNGRLSCPDPQPRPHQTQPSTQTATAAAQRRTDVHPPPRTPAPTNPTNDHHPTPSESHHRAGAVGVVDGP